MGYPAAGMAAEARGIPLQLIDSRGCIKPPRHLQRILQRRPPNCLYTISLIHSDIVSPMCWASSFILIEELSTMPICYWTHRSQH
jgi:hypothetical protein